MTTTTADALAQARPAEAGPAQAAEAPLGPVVVETAGPQQGLAAPDEEALEGVVEHLALEATQACLPAPEVTARVPRALRMLEAQELAAPQAAAAREATRAVKREPVVPCHSR